MERLGRVPEPGDVFTEGPWRITVTAADERRVRQLRVEQAEAGTVC